MELVQNRFCKAAVLLCVMGTNGLKKAVAGKSEFLLRMISGECF